MPFGRELLEELKVAVGNTFGGVTFIDGITFVSVQVNQRARFSKVTFGRDAVFAGARLKGDGRQVLTRSLRGTHRSVLGPPPGPGHPPRRPRV
ncbi:hypothetical protein [Streptomyces laculatispora]|uniref:hypothetical protein n=1 Tax=Streptomyces laculatispora TaxID=887464 RepID=UPI001A945C2D|nr:hypothetical protein [Streptomyces laculatispora]MBO0915392.1 hypothetical protein [Streptomyces laculatispora]